MEESIDALQKQAEALGFFPNDPLIETTNLHYHQLKVS